MKFGFFHQLTSPRRFRLAKKGFRFFLFEELFVFVMCRLPGDEYSREST